eukprot:CAMPEP_0116040122 /NCGR_PEP_ID=MMETSP0321-20121206/24138_1 /TAXON_ID=163516 /ORGANISM="Leptocylindrus danicus var. danicus, Strain B650" /LENGTH=1741 /DNA_ID=CAMNT_0003519811 /DNA_START=2252 /DNA_END=7480 /DNA_ORIENTATION=-
MTRKKKDFVHKSEPLSLSIGETIAGDENGFAAKVAVVSDSEILHVEGNTLRLDAVFSNNNNDDGYLLSPQRSNSLGDDENSVIASNPLCRGFACFAFNPRCGRVAFSPRSFQPKIHVEALMNYRRRVRKKVCTISDGASVEYSSMDFDHAGARLAAVGKGAIDAKLWVWQLPSPSNFNETQVDASLIFCYELDRCALKCLFSPSSSAAKVGLIYHESPSMSVCLAKHFLPNEAHVDFSNIVLPVDSSSSRGFAIKCTCSRSSQITCAAWELQDRILVGDSTGCLYIFSRYESSPPKNQSPTYSCLQKIQSSTLIAPLKQILILRDDILTAFECGHIQRIDRGCISSINTARANIVVRQSLHYIKEGLADLLCNPSFDALTGITATGGIVRFFNICGNDDGGSSMSHEVLFSRAPPRVMALQSLVLAGKVTMPIIVVGFNDGTLKVWRETDGLKRMLHNRVNSVASKDIGSPVSSISSLEGSPVFVAGAQDGSIRFIHVSRTSTSIDTAGPSLRMTVLAEENIGNAPVSILSCSAPNKRLAAYCKNAEHISIIGTEPDEGMRFVGKAVIRDNKSCVVSLVWASSIQDGLLLVADTSGTIAWFNTAEITCNGPINDFVCEPLKTCCLNGISRLQYVSIIRPQGIEHQIYAAHVDSKGLTCFSVPPYNDCDSSFIKLSANEVVLGGSKESILLVKSVRASVIISGTSGGEILVFKIHRDGVTKTELVQVIHVHTGPVVLMIFNADGSRLYSIGADGSLFVHAVDESNLHQVVTSSDAFDLMASKALQTDRCQRLFDVSLGQENKKSMELAAKVEIEVVKHKLDDMKSRLNEAMVDNLTKEDMEKLDDKELVVDDNGMAALAAQTEYKIKQLLNSVVSSDAKTAVEAVRIRQQYWDNVENQSSVITPLYANAENVLRSFTLAKQSTEEANRFESIRCVVDNAIKYNNLNDDENIARRAYDLLKKEDILSSKYFSHDGVKSNGMDCDSVLYDPIDVQTNDKRHDQITLLDAVIRNKAQHFNTQFKSLQRAKEVLLNEIDSKNERIKEIANELGETHSYEKTPLSGNDVHVVNSVLTVSDSELKASPYETSKQKVEREEREEKERQAVAKARTGETARALDDMMHGVLKVKKQISAPATDSSRKEWMDELQYVDMSDEQKKLFENFQREAEDAKKAYEQQRQILEDEKQTLHRDIKSSICHFNGKWQQLLEEQFQTQLSIVTCQIYLHRLQLSLAEAADREIAITAADKELDGLISRENLLAVELEKVLSNIDDTKEKLHALAEQDKALSKSFRRQIQGASSIIIDQETVKMLAILYRNRDSSEQLNERGKATGANASLQRRSSISRCGGHDTSWMSDKRRHCERIGNISIGSDNSYVAKALNDTQKSTINDESYVISAIDPFSSLVRDLNVEDRDIVDSLPKAIKVRPVTIADVPEGFHVHEEVMEKLNNLRSQKVEKENEIRSLSLHYDEIQCYYERLNEKKECIRSSINELNTRKNGIIRTSQQKERMQELILRSRQGQNELDRAVEGMADYSESTLLPLQSVQDINLKIRLLGDDKICTLNKMRHLKRRMNKIKWENDYLDLKNNDAREEYTDIQMLRVTKQVKLVLSGGENEKEFQRVESMMASMSKMKTNHEKLLRKLEKERQVLGRSIEERMKENGTLREQLQNLHDEVECCEEANPCASEKKDQPLNKKKGTMKRIQARRKLVDLSRSQNEEIAKLSGELDKLLRKTYPSFSKTHPTRF